MDEKLENIRTSEGGKILFYILLGFVLGFIAGAIAGGHDNSYFSHNGCSNSASI